MKRRTLALVSLWSLALTGAPVPGEDFAAFSGTPAEPVFVGDFVDPQTSAIVELVPGLPWVLPDGSVANQPTAIGDVDLVVRTGLSSFVGAIPPTAPNRQPSAIPLATVEAGGSGVPVPFVVVISDGSTPPAEGAAISSPALEGDPVLVVAFADLDADGFIGVTSLDGDSTDAALEEEELSPVGRRFAFVSQGRAAGDLYIGLGAPLEVPLRIVVTAMAYVGDTRPGYFGGVVPEGPAVMTRVPSLLRTDPADVLGGGTPSAPGADSLLGVEIRDHFTPDPNLGAYGEGFTLDGDGSDATIDVADVRSGAPAALGIARIPNPATYDSDMDGLLRPGIDDMGAPLLLETLDAFALDTGGVSAGFRILTLDTLGNIASPGASVVAELRSSNGLDIVSPNGDADAKRETISFSGSSGAAIVLQGSGALSLEAIPEPGAGALGFASFGALWWARTKRARPN